MDFYLDGYRVTTCKKPVKCAPILLKNNGFPSYEKKTNMTWQLDHTQLSRFLQCPERYRLEFQEGLQRSEGAENLPMKFGQLLHERLEAWYGNAAAGHTLSQWAVPAEEKLYTTAHAIAIETAYCQQYASDKDVYRIEALEPLLTLQLSPDLPPYYVKVDAILRDEQGSVWGLETKTTARKQGLGDSFWQQWEMSSQISGEYAAIQEAYGECGECAGIIVNAIWFGQRQRASERGPAGFFVECERQVFSRTPEQLENWKLRTARTMRRLIQTVEDGRFEQNTRECLYCPYLPLCLSVDSPGVREAMFVKVAEPLAYMGKESA